jgi:hypothetical protein
MGVFQILNMYAIVSATARHETGKATGIISTVRTSAYSLGAALVAGSFAAFGVGTSGVWIAVSACVLAALICAARVALELRGLERA